MLQKSPMILFAGPTLTDKAKKNIQALGIDLRPPVKRGDIQLLDQAGYQGIVVLVDGYFKQNMSVGHAEIRELIRKDCVVYGLSSMGAIRAYEMQISGMKGYGKVYNWFYKEEDFQDDEVTLLHSEGPQYIPVSEPLIHFRECVNYLISSSLLKKSAGNAIINQLKALYFGKRNKPLFFQLLSKYPKVDLPWLKANFSRFRIKQQDLENFLENRVWES